MASNNRPLPPDAILVTGCSSGIGKACCDYLASRGRHVYGASRTPCAGDGWTHVRMDVTEEASVQGAIDEVTRREARIGALVHCAGMSLAGSIEDTTIDEAKKQLDTNFFGTARVLRAVLPVMRRQGSGRIVVIGSIGGLIGLPYIGYYSASKFALNGIIEALRMEIRPFGIEATILHPGDFNTAISSNQTLAAKANPDSAYFADCQRTVGLYDSSVKQARSPDVVAREVERLLSCRRLPVRAVLGSPLEVLALWMKSLLPPRSFEYLFRRSYRL